MSPSLRPYLVHFLLLLSAMVGVFFLFTYAGKHWAFAWAESPAREKGVVGQREAGSPSVASETADEPAVKPIETTGSGGWMGEMLANWLKYQEDLTHRGAISNEALLTFRDKAAYDKFLADAAAAGLKVKGMDPDSLVVRVGYDKSSDLKKYLGDHADEGTKVAANYMVAPPEVPSAADRSNSNNVPFGSSGLDYIGVSNNANYGKGVKIAVLDNAVSPESVFGNRLTSKQLAEQASADISHGTAVASIAGGINGVAPGSSLLSMAVVGADGMSDSFTLGLGIRAAADAGARILNISLGSYGDSSYLAESVAYAQQLGAVIVASNGNDGYTNSTYPARYEGVIGVGAIDVYGQVVSFSNASQNYGLTAPGLEVTAAVPGEQFEAFSGTSAAAPFVTGAIASVMSAYPGMSARDAADLLITYANDGGAAGVDADYGYGIINVDRVLHRGVPNRNDLAVTANYFDLNASVGPTMQYVVQNQGTTLGVNWQLETSTGGQNQIWTLPLLQPNAVTSISVPVNAADLPAGVQFGSRLIVPQGTTDLNPQNNGRVTRVQTK